jgi:hypothetical protein
MSRMIKMKPVVLGFEVLSQYFPEGTDENYRKFSMESR